MTWRSVRYVELQRGCLEKKREPTVVENITSCASDIAH